MNAADFFPRSIATHRSSGPSLGYSPTVAPARIPVSGLVEPSGPTRYPPSVAAGWTTAHVGPATIVGPESPDPVVGVSAGSAALVAGAGTIRTTPRSTSMSARFPSLNAATKRNPVGPMSRPPPNRTTGGRAGSATANGPMVGATVEGPMIEPRARAVEPGPVANADGTVLTRVVAAELGAAGAVGPVAAGRSRLPLPASTVPTTTATVAPAATDHPRRRRVRTGSLPLSRIGVRLSSPPVRWRCDVCRRGA